MGNPVSWLPDQEALAGMADSGARTGSHSARSFLQVRKSAREKGPMPAPLMRRAICWRPPTTMNFSLLYQQRTGPCGPGTGEMKVLGEPAPYTMAEFSPDGKYILIEYLVGPWSHEVACWRFASEAEVWNAQGEKVAGIYSYPLADAVPIHGETEGPVSISWRPTAPHTLYWVEALDGGDPMAEVPHRDRLMRLDAPFTGDAEEVFRAEHRIQPWRNVWAEEGGMLMLTENERMRRWRLCLAAGRGQGHFTALVRYG